jgi:hypothetical protein
VADPISAVQRVYADGFLQVSQLARRATDIKMVVAIQDCDARRVISAIFQAAEAIQNNWDCFPVANIADDAAHNL